MTDLNLWEVPKELKPLMDMCSHSPLNLVWFICTPSGSTLMMNFSNTLMFSSHQLTFGMLVYVLDNGITPALLDEINQEADDSIASGLFFYGLGDLQ